LKICRPLYKDEITQIQKSISQSSKDKNKITNAVTSISSIFKDRLSKDDLVKSKITDYVINKMIPLSHVEDPNFQALN
jgi:hypothetical protein